MSNRETSNIAITIMKKNTNLIVTIKILRNFLWTNNIFANNILLQLQVINRFGGNQFSLQFGPSHIPLINLKHRFHWF